jgi:lysophospholipase L1-like esterase
MLSVPGLPGLDEMMVYHAELRRIVNGPERPEVVYRPLLSAGGRPAVNRRCSRLLDAIEAVDDETDVVIVSLGLSAMLRAEEPAVFERELAALTDVLRTALGRFVVLVTPPPFRLNGTAGVRPFAAAVKRVADARGIPVADLFSAGYGVMGPESLFVEDGGLTLSADGQALAAQVIARALLLP